MTNAHEIQKMTPVRDPPPVSAHATYDFSISLHEYQGTAWIAWNQNFPGMVRLALALYKGNQPSIPHAWTAAMEVTNQGQGQWNTGQPWGTGWSASMLGVNAGNNAWLYMGVNTPVTG
jgi:hypothetical protein